ncbi:MAG: D-alanyl-D-alanine carboxypeptidase [Blastocatellia bacterium]|jgi:D-alanyl-D-alanine carboxypeptidase/D-alanyl-D-alanine-endopeptidase (penicillin-binding protein 4)
MRLIAPILVLALAAVVPAEASAGPSSLAALDLYRLALEESRLDIDRQGVLFETLDGERLLSYNVDCPFNPASVVKIATSVVAIEKLGPDYRYGTGFYTNGTFSPDTGELVGDLIVVGAADPMMTTENAFLVAKELRSRGVSRITGNFVVKGPLYLNFSMDRPAAGRTMKSALDVELWTQSIEIAYERFRLQTGTDTFESVTVDGAVVVVNDSSVAGLTPLFVLRSVPLVKILKQLNNYSNNWMASVIGAKVGGPSYVEHSVAQRFGIPSRELYFDTCSGLGTNGMRPTDVVKMLRHTRERLQPKAYGPVNIMPVAGVDPGTLDDRFLEPAFRGAVIAKTGTLRSVSALAGYMHTRNKGIVLFAIMNSGGSPSRFRKLQDDLVRQMFAVCGGPVPTHYSRPRSVANFSGAFIERAPGNIPESRRVAPAASN